MISAAFEALADDVFVFRLAETGKRFLPEGAGFPNADILEPSSADKAEAVCRGQEPGVSVWDREHSSLEQATRLWFHPKQPPAGVRGFGAPVRSLREIARVRERSLFVVSDPLPKERGPGGEGHSLIEGLKRPPGTARPAHKMLLLKLVEACTEVFE